MLMLKMGECGIKLKSFNAEKAGAELVLIISDNESSEDIIFNHSHDLMEL